MSKSKTELGVKVGYASIGNGTSEATLHLTGDATVDGIQTALKVIREELDFVTEVTSTVCEDAAYLRVRAASSTPTPAATRTSTTTAAPSWSSW